jgi:hypothetical protein
VDFVLQMQGARAGHHAQAILVDALHGELRAVLVARAHPDHVLGKVADAITAADPRGEREILRAGRRACDAADDVEAMRARIGNRDRVIDARGEGCVEDRQGAACAVADGPPIVCCRAPAFSRRGAKTLRSSPPARRSSACRRRSG